MSGFARVSGSAGSADIDVEMRSVNSRFLEVVTRAPRGCGAFEQEIKALVQKTHRRGRVDVSISYRTRASQDVASDIQWHNLDRAVSTYAAACKRYGLRGENVSHLVATMLTREDGLGDSGSDIGAADVEAIRGLVSQASVALGRSREIEGEALVVDIAARLKRLDEIRAEIASRMTGAPGRLRERMTERLKVLAPDLTVDPQRLALEVALLAEKVDVSEELSRLEIHLGQFAKTLAGHSDGIGRKLDFLTQEIGRELNTIGSKAQDGGVQGLVVDAKSELERAREQVQNIE